MAILNPQKLTPELLAKYSLVSGALVRTKKTDPRDTISIEIGDTKQIDFMPQFKVLRWNNEVNISIRLLDTIANPSLDVEGMAIVWKEPDREFRWYSVTDSTEGGFEFDIKLLSKPASNRFAFSLVYKGLEFFYQPPLANANADGSTWEVTPRGITTRANWASGSYAVYYQNCPVNRIEGKLYRNGKAGHIKRPKLTDAVGNTAWGSVTVDTGSGRLYVDVPQDFLDSAVYPITKAAGLEFGYTTVGGSTNNINETELDWPKAYSLPSSNGELQSISAYVSSSTSAAMSVALYTNVSGKPSTRLAANDTGVTAPASAGWTSCNITYSGIVSGTQYFLGIAAVGSAENLTIYYDTGADFELYYEYPASIPWPASTTTTSWVTARYSIYATYALTTTTDQEGFRWRADDGSETTATWLATQDTNITRDVSLNTRLRVLINATGDPASTQYKLRYKRLSGGEPSSYIDVPTASAYPIPTYQGAGTAGEGISAITPTWPTHLANDIALLFVETAGGEAATLSTAAGFVEVTNSPQFTGTGTAGTRLTVFWCRATSAAMENPTVADSGNHQYARIITFRGCITSGDPWDVTAGNTKASASTSCDFPSVVTTKPNCLIVLAASRDNDSAAAAWSAITNANLASITERHDAGTTQGNGGGFVVAHGEKAAAGTVGTTTSTVTSSVNAMMTIALKPPDPPPIYIAASSNITASGENTTAQLTAPSGKTTSDFVAGRMQDDENPADAVNITTDDYTEMEWCMQAQSGAAVAGATYQFRVYDSANNALSSYSVTPEWTITGATTTIRDVISRGIIPRRR